MENIVYQNHTGNRIVAGVGGVFLAYIAIIFFKVAFSKTTVITPPVTPQ